MKRLTTFVLVALISLSAFAGEGEKYQFYKDYSHWMISAGGGFNMFVTERHPIPGDPLNNYRKNFTGAGFFNIGYMINPSWGFMVEYGYTPISKALFTKAGDQMGQGHEVSLLLDLNVLNLFKHCRDYTKWNLDFMAGGGLYFYNTPYTTDPNTGEIKHYFTRTLMIPVSMMVEYCPISQLGVFFRATGKLMLADNINYESMGFPDGAIACSVGLRYNIESKGKPHVRVTDICTYERLKSRRGGSNEDGEEGDGEAIAKALEGQNKTNADLQKQIADLNKQIAELNSKMEGMKHVSTTDTIVEIGGDYNALRNDMEFLRQQIMMANGTEENAVYFEKNSSRVTAQYELAIAKVARNMMLDPKLKLDIVAYCDNTGSAELNKKLGEDRIDAVRYILINRYRIDQNRIQSRYEGQVNDAFEAVNRRCDMIYK